MITVEGRESKVPRTQAEWDRKRAEVKAEAAEVVEANHKEAADNLAALRAKEGFPTPAPRNEAGEIEADADEDESEEVKPYGEWTNDELSEELKARELPHSGNKDELVARLEESDKGDSGE